MSDMSDQKPTDKLPTQEDLQKLSNRGMVCYAVRCAMRVVHLTESNPSLHKKAQACLDAATRFCLAADKNELLAAVDVAARAAADAATNAIFAANIAAADIAYAAHAAAYTALAVDEAEAAADTAYAAYAAATKAARAAYADDTTNVAAARADYEKLLQRTGHQAGELGDPIKPSKFGPLGKLWPETEQQEQPAWNKEEDQTPLINVYFDESSGLTEDDELLVLKYLHLLYQQQGRPGLKIVDDQRSIYIERRSRVTR